MNRPGRLVARVQATKGSRAWQRYGEVRGNVLAGGVAYFTFFSLFPALTLGFTAFGLVVGGRPELQTSVVDAVNDMFGTVVIGVGGEQGIVSLDQLIREDILTVTGLTSLVVLLFTGLGWIGALRDGVSAVFGRPEDPNVVRAKAADLGMLALFGLSVLASAVGSVLVTTATGPVLDWLGLSRSPLARVLVSLLSALVLLAIDFLLFVLIFRVLAGVPLTFEDVFTGALVGAVGMSLLKLGAGVLLGFAGDNQFLAAFAIVVGMLIWMNLAARVTLYAAAWAAVTTQDRRAGESQAEPMPSEVPSEVPSEAQSASAPVALVPTYGPRAADRTTLLAGAVLGATAAVGARLIGQAGRGLIGMMRRP